MTSGSQSGGAAFPPGKPESLPDRRRTRPLSVTLLITLVLIFTGLNLLRLILTLQSWGFLASLLPVSPWYLALSGLVWSLLGCALIWGLWLRRVWAPAATQLISVFYVLYYWIDRLFVADRRSLDASWPFTLGVCLVVLLLSYWTFKRRRIRNYFGAYYDDGFEHSTIARDQSQRPPGRRSRSN